LVLLDTCALIWMVRDDPMSDAAREEIRRAARAGELFVSPVSAWEVGVAAKRGRLGLRVPAETWMLQVFARSDLQTAALTPEIAIRSCFLPADFHADLADRFIVATAIEMGLKLITRDENMLRYGRRGYLPVIAC
jgi:PIN domain nuclease of toxin-antitoxin system